MQEKKIGELIAENREKKGLSQRQLAKAINISNAELSKIESGEREVPNPKILRKLSKYIDLNYNEMMSMVGLGAQSTPLNPFIKNYYKNLKGVELEDAWVMATSSIKNNEVIIETLNNQIRNNEDMEQDKKDILIDTIQDLAYQNETNKQIIDILDENRFEEAKKMLEKIKMFLNKIQIFGFLCSTIMVILIPIVDNYKLVSVGWFFIGLTCWGHAKFTKEWSILGRTWNEKNDNDPKKRLTNNYSDTIFLIVGIFAIILCIVTFFESVFSQNYIAMLIAYIISTIVLVLIIALTDITNTRVANIIPKIRR